MKRLSTNRIKLGPPGRLANEPPEREKANEAWTPESENTALDYLLLAVVFAGIGLLWLGMSAIQGGNVTTLSALLMVVGLVTAQVAFIPVAVRWYRRSSRRIDLRFAAKRAARRKRRGAAD